MDSGSKGYFFWHNRAKPAMIKQRLKKAEELVKAAYGDNYTKADVYDMYNHMPGDIIWAADRFKKKKD